MKQIENYNAPKYISDIYSEIESGIYAANKMVRVYM
jgi:hypothetical protein